ncbi:MAG: ABC transporter permease [candidate division Zixibacteria bacterium]|nr:ABC transporter permease [candidate division Zixibacteria bacterium]
MRNIRIIYKKELLDTIRDKRTIISMIVVPIFIFPLMTLGFSAFAASMAEKSAEETHQIAIIGGDSAPELYALIDSSTEVSICIIDPDSLEQAINSKKVRAALIIPKDFQEKILAIDSTGLIILFNAAEAKSNFAADKIAKIVNIYHGRIVEGRFSERNLDPLLNEPFELERENVAKEKMGSFLLSMFIPYIIIILCMIGAMYTAIDLTAGEKERGTLETILVSPVPRWQLATGKFLTILTTSVVSTVLVLSSMTGTMYLGLLSTTAMTEFLGFEITPVMIFVILLMMIPTACLLSALLMSISIFAKSYKEAQSYISPLMILVILPALVSFIPGVELNMKLAFLPLVNICLSIKEALMGNINWLYIAIIFTSTVIYAAFAIFVTHRVFEKESVLFRS